jgi:hypothetical protein
LVATIGCGGSSGPSDGVSRITSLSPASAIVGTSLYLTIIGTAFTPQTIVVWNGNPVPTTFSDATTVYALLQEGELRHPGSARVAVREGPNGATSASVEFVVNNPVPHITGVSPSELAAGQGPVTLTVSGNGLFGYTRFRWNGSDRPSALVDASLLVDLEANDVASPTAGQLVAVNDGPGGGSSEPFVVPVLTSRTITSQQAIQLQATSLLAGRDHQRVYATVAAGDARYPSSVAVIDAASGVILRTTPLSFEPNLLALSADQLVLYAASTVDSTVSAIDVATGHITLSFSMAGFAQYEPSAAGGLAEVPGEPGVLAVAIRSLAVTPDHEGYVVFDHGVARPTRVGRGLRTNVIHASDQPGELYGVPENGISALFRLIVGPAGIDLREQVNIPGARGVEFAIENRHLVSDAGTEVDLTTNQIVRSIHLELGGFAFDLTANRYYWMIAGIPTLRAYDLQTGLSVGPVAIGGTGSPRDGLVRWARDGFAFRTFTQVILVRTNQADP